MIMAKVDGPLFSVEARGKIADSIVFFPWKGRHIVRQWLKPTQPHSVLQGFVRVAMISIGKTVAKIFSVTNGDGTDSKLYTLSTAAAPAGMNWNADYAAGFLGQLQSAGGFVTASWTALIAAYSALGTAVLTAFRTNATALGLSDTAFSYGYTANVEAGFHLFAAGYAAYNNSLTAGAPFNTVPTSWAASDVNNFKSAFTTA